MALKTRDYFHSFFFCNYFYGICSVALAIEGNLQQGVPLNAWYFYPLIFSSTTWFYTRAYIASDASPNYNTRTTWYYVHKKFVRFSQSTLLGILLVGSVVLLYLHYDKISNISWLEWGLLLIFPLVGAMYYGLVGHQLNLRNIGWLKPFWIGFTWAGMVNVYPILFYNITQQIPTSISFINLVLFFKNFMFVTVLCILFDIKDYADDYNRRLKTFVVENGLRRTIFFIVIPLSIAGLGSFLFYSLMHQFSIGKIIINTLPFLAMIAVAYSMHRRKPILYYLILIDGLMLFKAICGSIGIVYF
jgi:hypothetical protein